MEETGVVVYYDDKKPFNNKNKELIIFDLYDTIAYSKKAKPYIEKNEWIPSRSYLRETVNKLTSYVAVAFYHPNNNIEFKVKLVEEIGEMFNKRIVYFIFYGKLEECVSVFHKTITEQFEQMGVKNFSRTIMVSSDGNPDIYPSRPSKWRCGDYPKFYDNWNSNSRKKAIFMDPEDFLPFIEISIPEEQELVIMVGQQGSGKSTTSLKLADKGYQIVNRKPNFIKLIRGAFNQKKSVVFDATNPKVSDRKTLIELANNFQIPCRIFWCSRSGWYDNELRENKIPDIALNIYSRDFQIPSIEEGVKEVFIVN